METRVIMVLMRLSDWAEATLLPEGRGFISITGGGGKTSLLSLLGRHFADKGLSVLITTTTRVMSPHLHDYGVDEIYEGEDILLSDTKKGHVVFYAEHSTMDMKKWLSPRTEILTVLADRFDVVIAEADGSRGLPLKIHTERDPVIHPRTTACCGVMGLWGCGTKIYSSVFGDGRDGVINDDYLQWYFSTDEGLSKGMQGHKAFILNGGDLVSKALIEDVLSLKYPEGISVAVASVREDVLYGSIQ